MRTKYFRYTSTIYALINCVYYIIKISFFYTIIRDVIIRDRFYIYVQLIIIGKYRENIYINLYKIYIPIHTSAETNSVRTGQTLQSDERHKCAKVFSKKKTKKTKKMKKKNTTRNDQKAVVKYPGT